MPKKKKKVGKSKSTSGRKMHKRSHSGNASESEGFVSPMESIQPESPELENLAPPSAHDMEVEAELSTIYGEEDPGSIDMTKLEKSNRSWARRILVGLVVFFGLLTLISWAGFFFFSPGAGKFSGDGVTVMIEGPREVRGGDLVTYAIVYTNGEDVPLGTASLEVRLPKEFIVQETDPQVSNLEWKIGSVAPGKEERVLIKGVFMAPLEQELDVQTILTYRPADFNSEFQKVETAVVNITDSVYDLTITGAPKVLPGDQIELSFDYTNTSQNTFTDVIVRTAFPEAFIPESSEPAADDDDISQWTIPTVAPKERGTITVIGSFASNAKGRIDIGSEVGFLDEEEQFKVQRAAEFSTDVLEGDLVTSLILNGKNDKQPVNFGETLRYTISYRNTGSVTLGDVGVALVFETTPHSDNMLLWNNLQDYHEGIREGNRISWTSEQIESLERIGADDDGTLNIEIPILNAPLAGVDGVDYRINAWVETSIDTIDGESAGRVTKTQPIEAIVNSNTTLASDARYFNEDGQPIGNGPLPPNVGSETQYRVTWRITNDFHELSDLKLSAKLPPNVAWNGYSDVDAGELRFDAAAEKMIWELNWLPVAINDLSVSFDVNISPAEEQRGKIPTLIDASILEATDKVTGASILLSEPPITTAISGDDFAIGMSRVE